MCASSKSIPDDWSIRPATRASSTPSSVRGVSVQPMNRLSRFHVLWPCRTKQMLNGVWQLMLEYALGPGVATCRAEVKHMLDLKRRGVVVIFISTMWCVMVIADLSLFTLHITFLLSNWFSFCSCWRLVGTRLASGRIAQRLLAEEGRLSCRFSSTTSFWHLAARHV